MIDISIRIHDNFSVEFKVGYVTGSGSNPDQFALNMWMFVPNSLDINDQTYTQSQFYRDIKSNVRLITPIFLMREIVSGKALPLRNLEHSFRSLAQEQSKKNIAEYEYQIKMFMSIFKSSVRDEVKHIIDSDELEEVRYMSAGYINTLTDISTRYRELRPILANAGISEELMNLYSFGDEFMGSTILRQSFRLIKNLKERSKKLKDIVASLREIILAEQAYQQNVGYPIVDPASADRNRDIIFRNGVLKKYIESDLFLKADKKRDGIAMEQFYYSIAAGISMIFATIIAFSVQQRFGNFTMPLFVALVVSYMLKDRIKDVARYYFAYRLKAKYFDNKTTISIKDKYVGWLKEGMDYITEDKVPREVLDIRNRSPLLQAENRIHDEKIILYRKMVEVDSVQLNLDEKYTIAGVNDIFRLSLVNFIHKTDNPEVPIYTMSESGSIDRICGDKIYYINLLIQLQHEDQLDYKRYRLVFNRLGILEIEQFQ